MQIASIILHGIGPDITDGKPLRWQLHLCTSCHEIQVWLTLPSGRVYATLDYLFMSFFYGGTGFHSS